MLFISNVYSVFSKKTYDEWIIKAEVDQKSPKKTKNRRVEVKLNRSDTHNGEGLGTREYHSYCKRHRTPNIFAFFEAD